MLADEVELNWKAYKKFKAGESWPVRKVTRNAVEC